MDVPASFGSITVRLGRQIRLARAGLSQSVGVEQGQRGGEGTSGSGGVVVRPRGLAPAVVEQVQLAGQGLRLGMLMYANHLGLNVEQISRAGEQRGNFPGTSPPSPFLISAAYNLDRAPCAAYPGKSWRASASSSMFAAAMLSSRCLSEEVPGIRSTLGRKRSSHARATCAGVQ